MGSSPQSSNVSSKQACRRTCISSALVLVKGDSTIECVLSRLVVRIVCSHPHQQLPAASTATADGMQLTCCTSAPQIFSAPRQSESHLAHRLMRSAVLGCWLDMSPKKFAGHVVHSPFHKSAWQNRRLWQTVLPSKTDARAFLCRRPLLRRPSHQLLRRRQHQPLRRRPRRPLRRPPRPPLRRAPHQLLCRPLADRSLSIGACRSNPWGCPAAHPPPRLLPRRMVCRLGCRVPLMHHQRAWLLDLLAVLSPGLWTNNVQGRSTGKQCMRAWPLERSCASAMSGLPAESGFHKLTISLMVSKLLCVCTNSSGTLGFEAVV